MDLKRNPSGTPVNLIKKLKKLKYNIKFSAINLINSLILINFTESSKI
jgi:hypothetical protein